MTDYAAQFAALYDKNSDPWNYANSTYEKMKYDATCAELLSASYVSGLEVGCSIGVLSARLAQRCRSFLAIDVAERAVRQAARRLANIPGARAEVARVPLYWPEGAFDLIVLSEVLYYMTAAEISDLAHKIALTSPPGAECVLVNWRGATEAEFTGAAASRAFCKALEARRQVVEIIHPCDSRYDHMTLVLT